MENHNLERKIAVINDVTGFGKCGAMVSMPIISAIGMQCCVVPTAVFSNHTAYKSFFMEDYTDRMERYFDEWRKLGLRFDGILTGFYGSGVQIDIVCRFIEEFSVAHTKVIVDPIMGDNGVRYATYTDHMCEKMAQLVARADIITPNLTEACILTGVKYREKWEEEALLEMCRKLYAMGPKQIVVTGIDLGNRIGNYVYEQGEGKMLVRRKTGKQRCGTGDIFSAIAAAEVVDGKSFEEAVITAAEFIGVCIEASDKLGMPIEDGVCFERFLGRLCHREKELSIDDGFE